MAGIEDLVKLGLVVLVVAVVIIGAIFIFNPSYNFFRNLFSWNDTGIHPNLNDVADTNLQIPSGCYEKYSECRICVIGWKNKTNSWVRNILAGEEVYFLLMGTEGCRGENAFISVWKDNLFVDELETEKKVEFSDEKVPAASFALKFNRKGTYYPYVFKDDISQEMIKKARANQFENWVYKQTGVENPTPIWEHKIIAK